MEVAAWPNTELGELAAWPETGLKELVAWPETGLGELVAWPETGLRALAAWPEIRFGGEGGCLVRYQPWYPLYLYNYSGMQAAQLAQWSRVIFLYSIPYFLNHMYYKELIFCTYLSSLGQQVREGDNSSSQLFTPCRRNNNNQLCY